VLDDEDKGVRDVAEDFYSVLDRLGEADQTVVPDCRVRVAKETNPNDSLRVYKIRLKCAVSTELAYEKVRRSSCTTCGLKWDRSALETIFSPHALVFVS